MSETEFEQLQVNEKEAYLQYKQVLDQSSIYRNKWLAIYKEYANELDRRRKETVRAITAPN